MHNDTPSTVHALLQTHYPDGLPAWQRVEALRQQDDAASHDAAVAQLDLLLTQLDARLARNQALQEQLIHEGVVRSGHYVLDLLAARTRAPSLPPLALSGSGSDTTPDTLTLSQNQGETA